MSFWPAKNWQRLPQLAPYADAGDGLEGEQDCEDAAVGSGTETAETGTDGGRALDAAMNGSTAPNQSLEADASGSEGGADSGGPSDGGGMSDGAAAGGSGLAAGRWHTCALGEGVVRCWGQNADGQLADELRIRNCQLLGAE